MKGLLCKDWAILLNSYKKNFLIMVVLYLGMAVCLHMDYLCYALVAVCGVYASSTMNFDDYAHWDTYARTLPVTPGQVVGCKYLLGLLLTLFGSVCAAVGIFLAGQYADVLEAAFSILVIAAFSLLLRISLRVIAVGGVAMLCFSELLAAPLSRFFVGYDAELLELTTLGMKLYSLSFLLCGFNIFGSAFFTALNNGIVSAVISFLRTLVFQVTAILVLPHLLGMNGIWLSVVAAEIAALFVNAFFLVKNRKKYQY